MQEILAGTQLMLFFAVAAAVVVMIAMMADLASGLYKSKLRGEFTRSELLKRTGYKFCLYEGSMLIAICVDLLIHFTHIAEWVGLPRTMQNLPLVTFIMAIFWCAVEYLSIREKASDKLHSRIAKVEKLAGTMFTKDELVKILTQALTETREREEGRAKREEPVNHTQK